MTLAEITEVSQVSVLDNGGMDCLHCQLEGHVVTMQIYFDVNGERVMEDGCSECMLEFIFTGLDNLKVEVQA